MKTNFFIGDAVFIEDSAGVPVRYTDRSGVITGTVARGRGLQYVVAFPGRRATPFTVAARDLTLAN